MTRAFSPTLSVVVPTRDTRDLTLRCLESITAGGGPGREVIVVDDASSDGTAEAVHELDHNINVLRRESSVGFSAAVNLGMRHAGGDMLLLLTSDTELRSGAVERALDAFAGDPRLGIAGAELMYPNGTPQWSAGRRPTFTWMFVLASGLAASLAKIPGYRRLKMPGQPMGGRIDWVTGAAMMIRRRTWNEAGPLDEGYRLYCQDLDLCLAASDAGWKVKLVPGFRALHHHGATISSLPGAVAFAHPELLWSDLIRWFGKHRGPLAAERARTAVRLGGSCRVLCRRAMSPFIPGPSRDQWRLETEAYASALAAVNKLDGDPASR